MGAAVDRPAGSRRPSYWPPPLLSLATWE
jgi:hypothetical protein